MKKIMLFGLIFFFLFGYEIAMGKNIEWLHKQCPECKPFLYGALSSEPTIAIPIPKKMWHKLSSAKKNELFSYMNRVIQEAKRDPSYFLIHKDASKFTRNSCRRGTSICRFYIMAIKNMDKEDWKIIAGRYNYNLHKIYLDNVVACGKSVSKCE